MKKFFVLKNRDAADVYVSALFAAGFGQAVTMDDADFLLYDYERGSGGKRKRMEEFLKEKPGFIYPHTPLSWFIWDGAYKPLPVKCNFVAGEGTRLGMIAYGYPHRVEACGFPRCEVRPFERTLERNLLFVPARTRRDGGYASVEYKQTTPAAFRFILDHREQFAKIDMCYTHSLENVGILDWLDEATAKDVSFHLTDPYRDPDPLGAMIKRIQSADLVIACETVGCVAVAMGKPTVFYNAGATPATLAGSALHFERYRQFYQFPLTIEAMTIKQILSERLLPNPEVERWKQYNIGGNFDAGKFVNIVKEYL